MIDQVQNISSLSLTRGLESLSKDDTTTSPGFGAQVTPGTQTGMSFAEIMGGMATDAMNNIRQGEHMSFEGIKGTASTREVVDAVLSAEQSLQTALAMRDKIVSAYLDITKMQI